MVMPTQLAVFASSPDPQVIRIVSSGPGWLVPIAAVLVGAAAALVAQWVVQIHIVPHVEKRKRREDRWERDVRELGELLAMRLPDLAAEAYGAQSVYRKLRQVENDEYDQRLVGQQARDAQQATWAFGGPGEHPDELAARSRSIDQS